MSKDKIVLLFSGGVDSTLTALRMKPVAGELIALSVDYVGRPQKERQAAAIVARELNFSEFISFPLETDLTARTQASKGDPLQGWIPYRNLLFWAIAAHVAAKQEADTIAAGHDRADAKTFSDASWEFFKILARILRLNGRKNNKHIPRIELPLLFYDDSDDIARTHRALLEKTWSCWVDSDIPCESCYSCLDRLRFFASLEEAAT